MNIIKTKKIIITFCILTSCMTIPTQNYFVENKNNFKHRINKSLKIQLFQDLRKGENTDKTGLIFVPFLKSAGAELNFPEADRMSINTPIKYYIADILKIELENEYNFKNIYISDEKNNFADYVISGNINTFFCSRKFYTYWLGIFGPLTWYFGLPVMGNECNLNIEITLQNRSGKNIYSKIYFEESLIYSGLYYNLVDLSLVFPDITKKLVTKVLEDFRPFLEN